MPSSEASVRLSGVPFLDKREPRLPVERTPRCSYVDRATALTGLPYTHTRTPKREWLPAALGDRVGDTASQSASHPFFSNLLSFPFFFVHFLYRPHFLYRHSLSARSVSVTQRYYCLSVECAGNDSTPFPETAAPWNIFS